MAAVSGSAPPSSAILGSRRRRSVLYATASAAAAASASALQRSSFRHPPARRRPLLRLWNASFIEEAAGTSDTGLADFLSPRFLFGLRLFRVLALELVRVGILDHIIECLRYVLIREEVMFLVFLK
ncbi:hypothetical protein AXF42_Ash012174 [Apostasia shenzhenica]|uniref:Uncharacterized protein n=1 Tax=Apostasia shenzhenica TaxID=1088818 RepID=A0A2I0B469_9ASPA|nr:hypothetical protein AXF42_Ash012174 [Apostasia shenzhenica]